MASVKMPTPAELKQVGSELGMNLSDQDVAFFLETMGGNVAAYNLLESLPDNLPVVKYPRTPGYRPEGEENKYNAWYVKTTIKGAPNGKLAGIHIEDQVDAKKCGHLKGKKLVSEKEMVKRIEAAVRGKRADRNFVIMARTDAVASEGLERGIERARRYRDAGADMIFAEAVTSLDEYRAFARAVGVPVLANITEFGRTPLFTVSELRETGVRLVLYPLSAFRAMNAAALKVFGEIRSRGTQKKVLGSMQTRAELYEFLGYRG